MCKKIFFIVTIFLVASFAFGEEENIISKFDGNDWRSWSVDRKIGYLQGFMAGHAALRDRFAYEGTKDTDLINEYFYIPLSIRQIAQRLDNGYKNPSNRNLPLHLAVYVVTEKVYWGEEGTSNPENNQQNNPESL